MERPVYRTRGNDMARQPAESLENIPLLKGPAPLTDRLNWIWFHPLSRRMGMVQMNGFTRVVDCGSAGWGRR